MRTKMTMLVIGAALMISGCQKQADDLVAPTLKSADRFSSSPSAVLLDVDWTLIRMDRDMGGVPMPRQAPWFHLSSRTADVVGSTGCNDYTGRYDLTGERFMFTDLAPTRRHCAELATMEDNYLRMLRMVDRYRFDHDMLVLMKGNEDLAWFSK